MSDYEPFEAAQGDPWSTDPVGDSARQRREPEAETYQDDSQVVARVPHVGEEPSTDQYRDYGHSRSSHRGRRSHSQRPGIPAPVWVVVGMGLVVLIASPFLFFSNNSGDETALDAPNWEAEMPAPDADPAPAWSPPDNGNLQWEQPEAWDPAMATTEPNTPAAWGQGGDWENAPTNAPYAYDAADPTVPASAQPNTGSFPPGMTPNPSTHSLTGPAPNTGWDTSIPPATPTSPVNQNYQALGTTPQPAYPATSHRPTAPWSDRATMPAEPSVPHPTLNANSWDRTAPTPSLTTPQPENVMPGYGSYPTVQSNPYIGNSAQAAAPQGSYANTAPGTPAYPQQHPSYAPKYPVAGEPTTEPYPVPSYPQTASKPAAPMSSLPPGGTSYSSQPVAPPTAYPPATRNPYPLAAPAAPTGQPGYGTGASNEASQRSVARLNGTIQEPAARQAYDDRARHSYY